MDKVNSFLIIANGEQLEAALIKELSESMRTVVLDGAYAHVEKLNIQYEIVLGDFDSILLQDKSKELPSLFLRDHDQNSTDLEKGIRYCLKRGAKQITIASALGGRRTDHTLGNVSFLKKHHRNEVQLRIVTNFEYIEYVKNCTLELYGLEGFPASIMGFPACAVTSEGLLYDMKELHLELGVSESICNSMRTEVVMITIEGEGLLICDKRIVFKMVE
jgi:thiamine pyrophosphokinase